MSEKCLRDPLGVGCLWSLFDNKPNYAVTDSVHVVSNEITSWWRRRLFKNTTQYNYRLAPDKGEIRTEEGKEICAGATLMATHAYTRNPERPLGKEIDLQQWETLIFKGEHAENEHWRLVEDRNGQVGYAPAAFLVVILDTAEEEEESDATKKGQENSTEENRIGQEGERRKSYSVAVIDGVKRNSRIYVGDSIIRKTDTRLSRGEDVVVCLPGARIEHVTERVSTGP